MFHYFSNQLPHCKSIVVIYNEQFNFRVFFERKFGFSPEDANTVNSIVYVISAVASPLFGLAVDKTGRNIFWVTISIIVTIIAHGLLAFTFLNPYIGMVSFNYIQKLMFNFNHFLCRQTIDFTLYNNFKQSYQI